MTALRALAETCEFGILKDHLFRDRIVCGVRENAVRRKILQDSGLTLSNCLDIYQAAEATSVSSKKEIVYWPGMPAEIRDYISKREVYTSCKKEQRKEPLTSHNTPSHPWEIVGSDIAHFDNRHLCTEDYYSSYFEIDPLKDKTAREVIRILKRHFSGCGVPNKLMSDNGLSFNSYEFQQFATNYDMEHVTSSPHYPQGNGKVENAVKTAKSSLKKSKAARSESI